MNKEQAIEMLRADMRGEHQAIIQYLAHAYRLEPTGIAPDIEAIAREEMRHLDWLADAITELGGDPDMGRDEPDLSQASGPEMLVRDVHLEEAAVRQYREHIEAIDDPGIRRLLARIVHDELVHRDEFEGMAAGLAAAGSAGDEAPEQTEGEAEGSGANPHVEGILNAGVRHEYTVVLQYLYHAFVTDSCEEQDELQMAAINEMQHMGWLSEEVEENGGDPAFEHHDLFLSRDPVANLKADIEVEDEVTRSYTTGIPALKKPDLEALVSRIRDHEIYHSGVFRELLEEREGAVPEECPCDEPSEGPGNGAPPVPPIGSLKQD